MTAWVRPRSSMRSVGTGWRVDMPLRGLSRLPAPGGESKSHSLIFWPGPNQLRFRDAPSHNGGLSRDGWWGRRRLKNSSTRRAAAIRRLVSGLSQAGDATRKMQVWRRGAGRERTVGFRREGRDSGENLLGLGVPLEMAKEGRARRRKGGQAAAW